MKLKFRKNTICYLQIFFLSSILKKNQNNLEPSNLPPKRKIFFSSFFLRQLKILNCVKNLKMPSTIEICKHFYDKKIGKISKNSIHKKECYTKILVNLRKNKNSFF